MAALMVVRFVRLGYSGSADAAGKQFVAAQGAASRARRRRQTSAAARAVSSGGA
jgi:hypothetical protein